MGKTKKELKLYVWEDVLYDYTPGMAVALAENAEEARRLLLDAIGYAVADLAETPKEVTDKAAFFVYGGG